MGRLVGRCDRRGAEVLEDLAGAGPGAQRGHRHGLPGPVRGPAAGPRPGLSGRGRLADRPPTRRGHGPASRAGPGAGGTLRDHGPALRLDRELHRVQLREAAQRLRPRLLLLDPLVRLHGLDENNASEVAGLLAYLRELQRLLDLSVMLVHHTRKNATGGVASGQTLRGSSDLHAFGDSNLYLRRVQDRLLLSNEHRAAPAAPPVYLQLVATNPETTHLEVVANPGAAATRTPGASPGSAVRRRLLTRTRLREALGVKNERLGAVLESLEHAGRIRRTPAGWQRID